MDTGDTMTDVELTAVLATRLGQVRADLLYITDRWPDLYQLRIPGTVQQQRPTKPSAAARRQRDELARAEKAERRDSVLGESLPPMDVDVLDTLAGILATADELADRIAATAGAPAHEPPSTAYDFEAIAGLLGHVSGHLLDAIGTDPEALDDTQQTARTMRRRLDAALGELADGQRLSTMCAWCRGATTEAPVGGEQTLVVRVVLAEPVIVCESDLCSPPEADCGTWVRGRPAWPEREWEWLNKRLDMSA